MVSRPRSAHHSCSWPHKDEEEEEKEKEGGQSSYMVAHNLEKEDSRLVDDDHIDTL